MRVHTPIGLGIYSYTLEGGFRRWCNSFGVLDTIAFVNLKRNIVTMYDKQGDKKDTTIDVFKSWVNEHYIDGNRSSKITLPLGYFSYNQNKAGNFIDDWHLKITDISVVLAEDVIVSRIMANGEIGVDSFDNIIEAEDFINKELYGYP